MALLLIRHRTPFARLESEVQQLFKHIEKPRYVSKIPQIAHRQLSAGSAALRRPGIVIRALQTSFLGCRSTLSGRAPLKSRNIQTHRRSAFETDGMVRQDVLVYSYSARLYKYITLFGFVQTAFWGNMAYFMATTVKSLAVRMEDKISNPFMKRTMKFVRDHNGKITLITLMFGMGVFFFSLVYPLRSVTALTLLKGGKTVRVSTYSHFGRQRHFDTTLETINCIQGRLAGGATMSIKIKNHRFYYQLDKRDGIFHEKDLFDYIIGLKRNI